MLIKILNFSILLSLFFLNCNSKHSPDDITSKKELPSFSTDLLESMGWMNEPESFEIINKTLIVATGEGTDFFNNPEDQSITGNAPFLNREVQGDFVVKALVEPDFSSQWNAVSLMVYSDSLHWIKFAFENSDATGPGIVSVVTKTTSDDANGAILNEEKSIWLAIARKGNLYSIHWSRDGMNYKMARLTSIQTPEKILLGLEFQSPVGSLAKHKVHHFQLDNFTVDDLRKLK